MFRNKSTVVGLIIALVAALAIICYLVAKPSKTEVRVQHPIQPPQGPTQGPPQGPPQGPSQGAQPTVVLFYADWCGHSKNMMPAWKQAAQSMQEHGVRVIEMEQGQHKDEIQKSGVGGFPTIRLYPQGFPSTNFIKYKGDRSAESIVKFVQTGGKV